MSSFGRISGGAVINYVLDITPEFEDGVADTLNYIEYNLDNKIAADSLENKIRKHMDTIAENPFLHPYYHDEKIAAKGYRYVTIGSYILFYKIDETNKIVHISRFIYAKRNVKNMI